MALRWVEGGGGGDDGGTAAPEVTGCLLTAQRQASAAQGTHCGFLCCWRDGDEACFCTGLCLEVWTPSGWLIVARGRGEGPRWGCHQNEASQACKKCSH